MRSSSLLFFLGGLAAGLIPSSRETRPPAPSAAASPAPESDMDVESMLLDFAEDFRSDPSAREVLFGVEVRDAEPSRWHVYVGNFEETVEPVVEVIPDFPAEPIPYFTTDLETLTRIHRGELASLTAMGKAFSTDFAPLDLATTPGLRMDEDLQQQLVSLSFHFWTRGFPERIRFSDPAATRPLHGGNGVLFYYQEGFRSGYMHLAPGQHANEDPAMQTNPFPTLLVITRGEIEARIGDTECVLREGEAVFIGPGIRHELWIDESRDEGAEGVLLMFGEGA